MNEQPTGQPYDIPGGIECPRCKQKIQFAQGVTPGAGNQLRKGQILVCYQCALICMVGDSTLIPMSKGQVQSLPKMMQAQLLAVCRKVAEEATKRN